MTPKQQELADKLTNLQRLEGKFQSILNEKGDSLAARLGLERVRSAIKYTKEELDGANT